MSFHTRGPTSEFLYLKYTLPLGRISLRHDPMVVRQRHSGIFCLFQLTKSVRLGKFTRGCTMGLPFSSKGKSYQTSPRSISTERSILLL